ncbi:hypothetical protein [Dechloromonas agitata]|uniref:hypothetical protein n=1 Tax=Dechloromonas agitata TaxID=73030 RepID=UPI00047FCFED|nr:hypothetical protein [Dechloromonas agitata]
MLGQDGVNTDNIICPFCDHREGLLFEIDCGDWVAQCAACGAIGPGQASSPQQALQWFKPDWSAEHKSTSNLCVMPDVVLNGELQRLEDEMARLRMLVARMLDYLPRGGDLYHDALRVLS